jgi:signal transduction histidine kinase
MMVLLELDLNLKIINSNTEHSVFLGLNTSEVIGLDYSIVLGKINSNLLILFYQWITTNKQNDSLHFSYENSLRTGEYVVLDAYLLHDKISVFINIKPNLNVKETFDKKFKSFFLDHFEGAVLFLDADGVMLDGTQGVLNLFKLKDHNRVQFSREAMIGKSFLTLLENNNYHNTVLVFKEMFERTRESSESLLSDDVSIMENICQLFVSPLYVQDQIVGFYIFVHNLTLLREKDKLIESQLASLVSSSKLAALGVMAGGIAHEINNPITIISSITRILRKYVEKGIVDPEKFYKGCDDIDKTITRISKIISGLRTVSRDAAGEEFAPCEISNIFEDVLALSSEKFKANKILIDINLTDEVYQTVIPCRRVQLSQVFLNMLGNSFDAIEDLKERWIRIECSKNEGQLIIRFIDSGSGIPLEIQDKMLNPFFTTKEVGKGTGLGLSLSNSFIKNHNGKIEIDNNSQNTCFIITLPITGVIDAQSK